MEKKQPIEHIRTFSSSDGVELEQQDSTKPEIQDPNWTPGFWVRFPWIGFTALVVILFCCAASVVVLEVCNGQSVHQWPQKITPNVLLSIMNGVANICFAIAIGNGIAIAWWRKALKGSSISDLHRTWAFSSSLKEMVFSLKYFNFVALAALTAKLTLIDSTLMQKALTFYSEVDTVPMPVSNIRGFSSTEWPNTGYVRNTEGAPDYMDWWTLETYKLWANSAGVYPTTNWDGCDNGFCFFKVPGIGFAFDCYYIEEPIDIVQALKSNTSDGNSETVFDVSFETVYLGEDKYDSAHIYMNVTWTSWTQTMAINRQGCHPVRYNLPCRLMPHIVEYPAMIEHISDTRTISIGSRKLTKWAKLGDKSTLGPNPDVHTLNVSNKQQPGFNVMEKIIINETQTFTADGSRSKLAGIQLMLQTALGGHATASLTSDGFSNLDIRESGRAAFYKVFQEKPLDPTSCLVDYIQPYASFYIGGGKHHHNAVSFEPSLVAAVNQMMFALAVDLTHDDKSLKHQDENLQLATQKQQFNGTRYPYAVHYAVHWEYMWGAVAATICCVLLVLPVYWGFWQLGRKVTLNPFEIAHAFRSPVVAQAAAAAPEDLMKEVGHQEVRYGPVTLDGETYGRFGVAAPQDVAPVPEATLRESLRQTSGATDENGNTRRFSAIPESLRRLSMMPERNRRMSTLPEQ